MAYNIAIPLITYVCVSAKGNKPRLVGNANSSIEVENTKMLIMCVYIKLTGEKLN